MSNKDAENLISQVAAQLGEHFDAVQIMVTRNVEAVTSACYRGCGNWYARQGMAHEFIQQDKAQIEAIELAQVMPRRED